MRLRWLSRLVQLLIVVAGCAAQMAWLRIRHGPPRSFEDELRIGRFVAAAFKRLGGLYVKFGQLLAMRPDLLPTGIAQALNELLDRAPAEPPEQSLATLRDELGLNRIDEAFETFDLAPIGAASFGVVYCATLYSGETVAVKIQRHAVAHMVRADLALLQVLARLVDLTGVMRRFNVSDFVADFAAWTRDELDYLREARVMTWLRKQHADMPGIFIPQVAWQLTTSRVLVSTYLPGIWLTELDSARRECLPLPVRQEAARQLSHALLRQIFEFGIFHADPHPGNVCLLPNGVIGLIDFGIVGTLSGELRQNQLSLLAAVERQDLDAAFEAILRVLYVPPDARLRDFRRRFDRNINDWLLVQLQPNATTAQRSASRLLLANFEAARDCGLSFEPLAVRYYRTFLVLDHVARQLDPEFNVIDVMHAYLLDRFRRARLKTRETLFADGGTQLQMEVFEFIRRIPDLGAIIDRYARPGELISSSFDPLLRNTSAFLRGLGKGVRWVWVLGLLLLAYVSVLGAPHWFALLVPNGGERLLIAWALGGFMLQGTLLWLSRLLWARAYRNMESG